MPYLQGHPDFREASQHLLALPLHHVPRLPRLRLGLLHLLPQGLDVLLLLADGIPGPVNLSLPLGEGHLPFFLGSGQPLGFTPKLLSQLPGGHGCVGRIESGMGCWVA